MQVSLPILHHPKDGYAIDLSRLIDVTTIFRKRDIDSWDRDFCVYVFENKFGEEVYYGKGRYYDMIKYSTSKWLKSSRPFNHRNDLLKHSVASNWTCRIFALGLTSTEAHVLEAYLILKSNKKLTKPGTKEWDKESLINKRREKAWEKLMTEYLNLGNGNNPRITAKR